ncbi:MAG: DNA primase [Gammaproteobacteria bacterium]|nr:DNA primase [Gammaproteobacteria bacterium]
MVQFTQQFLDDLKVRVDAVHLVGDRVALERAGKSYKGKCPFHQEKTPSFHVYPDEGTYHCFGCNAHGSMIDFVMNTRNMTFPEAVEELARVTGMKMPVDRSSRMSDEQLARYNAMYSALEQAETFFRESLRSSKSTKEYLMSRGLQEKTVDLYRIGFAPDSFGALKSHLSHIKEDVLVNCGLLVKKDDRPPFDLFRNRVMFPIRNTRGRVIGFGGRVLDRDSIPKYINSPQSPLYKKGRELYGLHEAKKANQRLTSLLVVEGYMDVVTLAQHGFPFAIAPLGTALTEDQFLVARRYAPEIVCCFDGDEAGRKAAWRAVTTGFSCLRKGMTIRIVLLPDNHDPDSFVRQHGAEEFQALLDKAEPASDYFFRQLTEGVDVSGVEARVQVVEQALPHIRSISYETYQQAMFSRLSDIVKMSIKDIHGVGYSKRFNNRRTDERSRESARRNDIRLTKGERNVFTVLAHDFAFVRRIPDDLLATCRAWRKESFLCEVVCRIRDDELGNFSEVLASYSGSREQDVLSKFAAEPRPDIRGEALGDGPIDALGAIVYRLETNERRKRVPTETTPEAGKVYKDILKEGNASDIDHSRPNVE